MAHPVWYRPMRPRDRDEHERAATPLELLFDLCFVVAVAFAAEQLHHAIAEPSKPGVGYLVEHGVVPYLMVFFAIWWAWMNFTWFASAYDADDVPYRLATLVQITGVLVLAAGVPRAFAEGDFTIATIGYGIMRLALVGQWLRAAHGDPEGRRTALRFAVGVAAVQLVWFGILLLPESARLPAFGVAVLLELAVPIWAERARSTPWHPRHIAERYGLFTLIVLGETVLAATIAVQSGAAEAGKGLLGPLLVVALSGLVIVFSVWWTYFAKPAHRFLRSNREGFRWGYGHYLVFASAAALGAGVAAAVDDALHIAHQSDTIIAAAVAVPVAVLLLAIWALQVLPQRLPGTASLAYPLAALLVLATIATPIPVPLIALVCAGLVAYGLVVSHPPTAAGPVRRSDPRSAPGT